MVNEASFTPSPRAEVAMIPLVLALSTAFAAEPQPRGACAGRPACWSPPADLDRPARWRVSRDAGLLLGAGSIAHDGQSTHLYSGGLQLQLKGWRLFGGQARSRAGQARFRLQQDITIDQRTGLYDDSSSVAIHGGRPRRYDQRAELDLIGGPWGHLVGLQSGLSTSIDLDGGPTPDGDQEPVDLQLPLVALIGGPPVQLWARTDIPLTGPAAGELAEDWAVGLWTRQQGLTIGVEGGQRPTELGTASEVNVQLGFTL
jgi:hypothetical protein